MTAGRALRDPLTTGREAVRAGQWAKVEAAATRLDSSGRADDAHLLRGLAALEQVRKATAANQTAAERTAVAELSRVRGAGATEATVLAAECLIRQGELRLAETALQAVVRRQPDSTDAHRWLAAVSIDLNTPAAAARHLSEWGRLDPSAGTPYRWAGYFHKTLMDPDPAVEAYRSALGRNLDAATQTDVARELAEVLLDFRQDHQGALETLDLVPTSERERPDLLALRAVALWGLGCHTEATSAADEAVRTGPQEPTALRTRAQFHLQRDDPRSARPLLERAAALAPHDLGILKDLMDACQQAGDTAAAGVHRAAFDRTTALRQRMTTLYATAERRPWDAAPRREAALVCHELRRPDQAQVWAKAAVACDPTDRASRDVLAAVTESAPRPRTGSTLSSSLSPGRPR